MFAVAEAVPWYLNPVFLPAASGLLGVILGGLITGISTYLVDERRAKRERAREDRKNDITVRRAARLISQDLYAALGIVKTTLEKKRWTKFPHNPIALESQRKNVPAIAAELSLDGWSRLTEARIHLENLHGFYGLEHVENPLRPEGVAALTASAEALMEGIKILEPLLTNVPG